MAPLPYGTDIKSTELDDEFIDEMQKLSPEHGFWAKMMVDAHEQYASDYDTSQVVKNLSASTSSTRRDPCNAVSKGFREATIALSGPIVLATRPRNKHEREQKIIKDFFYRNPTPARPVPVEEDEDVGNNAPDIQVQATTAPIQGATATFNPTTANSSAEFYSQLLETLKTINQTAPAQQKIVVESREHEESVDLAKLQTSMLKLFYVNCDIDWDEGTVKNVTLATFSKGFKDLLGRTATVQEAQFANLLNTIFKTQPDDDDDELANPLERLMSLSVFPKKFNKAHLNASFQCADLESNMMYKNPSINPFHYAPQDCRALVKAAMVEIKEERNQFNWRVNEKDKKQISSVIEGVGRIESIDDVSRTCANMCGVMLAIVDVSKSKPLLYQVAYKFIRMIENKKTQTWMRDNSDSIAHVPFILMGKLHQCFQHLASFSQNSINTHKVEVSDNTLDVKQVTIAVKLISKFFKKMTEHIEDSSVPKDIPPFARTFFVEQAGNVTAVVPSLAPTEHNTAAKRLLQEPKAESANPKAAILSRGRRGRPQTNPSRWVSFMSRRALRFQKPSPTRLNSRMALASASISAATRGSANTPMLSARTASTTQTGRTFPTMTKLCFSRRWQRGGSSAVDAAVAAARHHDVGGTWRQRGGGAQRDSGRRWTGRGQGRSTV